MKRISYLLLASLALGVGCKSNTSTPSDIQKVSPNRKGTPPFITGWAGANLSATFQINSVVTNYSDGASTSGSEALVYLWDSTSGVPVPGGSVSINSTSVPSVDMTADNGGMYYQLNSGNSQTVPMLYDGSTLAFNVAGSSAFPALTDTINYINRQMVLTAPGLSDSLSASSGFTITWNHNSSSSDAIVVELFGDTSYYQAVTTDNGSFSVTSTMLTGFSTGSQIQVCVTRMNYKYAEDTYGRNYVMANSSAENDFHPLNP